MKPEKFDVEMTDPSGITGNEWCLVYIVVAVWKRRYCTQGPDVGKCRPPPTTTTTTFIRLMVTCYSLFSPKVPPRGIAPRPPPCRVPDCTYNTCPSRQLLQFIRGIFQQKALVFLF